MISPHVDFPTVLQTNAIVRRAIHLCRYSEDQAAARNALFSALQFRRRARGIAKEQAARPQSTHWINHGL